MCGFSDDPLPEALNQADNGENDEYGEPNHVAIAHLIAVANREVTQAACADGARNRGDTDKAHKSDERDSSNAGNAFT